MKRYFATAALLGTVARAWIACGLFSLALTARAQDAFEPDDTPATARIITNGETQNRSISQIGDVDWATFTIGSSGATTLRVETSGLVGDTEIWLYESRNLTKELAYNDNAATTTRFSLITLSNLAAGTYYIKVAAVGVEATIAAYTLRASWTDRTDSFEPDNTPATAKAITNGQTQEHSIHTVDDVDWASFSIGSNGATNLRIETAGLTGDTELWLFGPNSATTQLAYNDDSAGGKFSLITLNTLAEGAYFIKVTSFGLSSTISAYTLRATWTESGDSFESDNTAETAKPITNGQTQSHSIHVAGDVDWATFTIGSNGASNIRIETAGTSGDTEMWLYGPNSATTQVAYDDDNGVGSFSLITVGTLAPGTYHIKVGEFGNDATISAYTLRASWSDGVPTPAGDTFEVDNTPEAAKPIANGQTQNRSIHVAADLDWATFTIGSQGASNLRIETAGASGDTELWLYGPNSSTAQLAYDDDGNGKFSLITLPTLAPGTYYIKASSFRQGSTIAAYTLRATWTAGLPPPPPVGSRLVNLSIRTTAGTGSQTIIVGFVLSGTGSKQLLLRGIGPTLGDLGVRGAVVDPSLQLYSGATLITSNDNWGGVTAIKEAAASVVAFALPDDSRDAALLQTLEPGAYTLQMGGAPGLALVEAYAVGSSPASRLSNVSARSQVGTGADVLIAGFVISGDAPKTVLIRAIGPGLTQFGVTGVLADPRLDIFSGTNAINANDNWGGTPALSATFAQVGAFALPAASRDAAVVLTLQPGIYSAQISGVGATTGTALIEVYEVP